MPKLNEMNEKLVKTYKLKLAVMMSDSDIRRWLGDGDYIMKYSELAGYESLRDLLPEDKSFKIILTEDRANQGHWTALLRYDNTVEWFDSIGVKPDGELRYIPNPIRACLGEKVKHLSRLLNTSPWKVMYNKKKFQSLTQGVNTCGRWVIARVVMMKLGYTLEDFQDFVDHESAETGKPNDVLVVDLIT